MYNISSYFLLFASILAGPRNPVVFRLISETALKAQMPTELGDKFFAEAELLTISINRFLCEDLL